MRHHVAGNLLMANAADRMVANSRSAKRLHRLVQSASQHVPFYAAHWSMIASRLASMRFPEDLHELPVVRKQDLLALPAADLLDRNYRDVRLVGERTSGSSGQPMEIRKDPASNRRRSLRFLRALFSCGYRPGQRLLLITTRRTAGLRGFARWHYADLRDEQLLHEYQRVRPHVLYGPLSSLLQICEQAQREKTDLHRPTLLISTAEQLLPAQRALLQGAFQCPPADFYGLTELGLVAFRRPQAEHFEVASRDLLLEFLPLTDDLLTARLVVTELTGGAMPMIRYDTGDLIRRSAGQPDMAIGEFAGRRVDSIKLPSGVSVSPYRITMRLEALSQLRQYQVIQRKDLSLDVYLHADEAYAEQLQRDAAAAIAEICGALATRTHFMKVAGTRVAGKFRPIQSEAGVSA